MNQHVSTNDKRIIITGIIAVLGGAIFKILHIPVPWLLGPMVVMVMINNVTKWRFTWPNYLRDSGMVMVGYTIGLAMTSAALHEIARQLPSMILLTFLLMLWCVGIAYLVSKFSDSDFRSALLGSVPGGLTQVILLAEETKGINLAVVTVTQVVRLMIIVIMMPLLVSIPFVVQDGASSVTVTTVGETVGMFPNIIFYAVICVAFAIVGNKIHFPTAYLLGPVIGTAILQLAGISGPTLPTFVINIAQLLIGTHVGLMLHANQIEHKLKTFSLAIGSGFMLMVGSILLSILLTVLHHVTESTALLSLAPGGMDQMSIIAHEIGADLSIVSGYQLFRTFFIFFAVPPLLKWLFHVMERKKHGRKITGYHSR
ncbi:AbrB family transcriptional regulator [Virgibacillus soli]|uniref:AbrB family transcriptional regulator n=1 Tax=Paracerasibacillus soli TaxID=480284 RepID=A0ABU5CNN9_9BACI|nr:AbrB family transcriptional regulator [Virgibacillus soli]MDY0407956.1 AbrB family transcriptional regulator [Virgibacillus soli]